MSDKITYSVVSLRKYLPFDRRIEAFARDQWPDDRGVQFAAGTRIGKRQFIRGDIVTLTKNPRPSICSVLAAGGLIA